MTQAGPLQWRTGTGWLVLIGGGKWEENEAIHSAVISAIADESPIAFVPAADPDPTRGETFLSYYADLGAPPGYVVPIHDQSSACDPANYRRLIQASLIYIGGGDLQRLLETIEGTPVIEAIAEAFDNGAVIVGAGVSAMLLGKWGLLLSKQKIYPGWGWISDAIVTPHYTSDRVGDVRSALLRYPETISIGIPNNVALAFGPEGDVDTWTDMGEQVTVTIGPKFGR
ncbi:MAG TPA: Type 1 glutamine amidotransferase-like domain-containing protein [Anaerolineae bacterium]|nr:Type 1 glutamine amidotransferase-like domain-containing protein [Anaerolineae bacterium]